MKRRSFKKFIFTLALVFISTLAFVFGGASINNSARSFIEANAASDNMGIVKVKIANIDSGDFKTNDPEFTVIISLTTENINRICSGSTYSLSGDSVNAVWTKSYYRPAVLLSTDGTFPDSGADVTNSFNIVSGAFVNDNVFDVSQIPNTNFSGVYSWDSDNEDNLGFADYFQTTAEQYGAYSFSDIKFKNRQDFSYNKNYYFKFCIVKVELPVEPLSKEKHDKKISVYNIANSESYVFQEWLYASAELSSKTEESSDETTINNLYACLGINSPSAEMTYTVNYKEMTGYATYVDKSITFNVSKYIFFNQTEVEKRLYAANIVKKTIGNTKYYFKELADFNVNFFDSNGFIDGKKADLSERIILQAEKLQIADLNAAKAKGVINVKYSDFKYKDFFIKLTGNENITVNNMTAYFHSTKVNTQSGYTSITYDFTTMEGYLKNNYNWLVTLKADDFTISGTVANKVEVTKNSRNLIIKFANDSESLLSDLRIIAVAEITEDVEKETYLKYHSANMNDKTFSYKEESKDIGKIWLSDLKLIYSNWENVYKEYGEIIDSAITIKGLEDTPYYKAVGSKINYPADKDCAEIIIEYEHETLFYIVNEDTGEWKFKNFLTNEYSCKGSYFDIEVPAGYRVRTIKSAYVNTVDGDEYDPVNQTFYFNPTLVGNSQDGIIEVRYTLSDKWKVRVEHLRNITYYPSAGKNKGKETASGFAEKRITEKEVLLSAFKDMKNPTEEELKAFLGFQSLTVIGSFGAWDKENTVVTFENDVWTMKLAYPRTTIKITQADGTQAQLRVPLTSFAEWTNSIGQDWSIQVLNYSATDPATGEEEVKDVFKSEVDVKPQNLYGYFYVSVFKEQIKDINTLFQDYTAGGCRVFFKSKEIKGSDLYKSMNNNRGLLPTIGGLTGFTVGLLFGHPIIGGAVGTGTGAVIQYSILSLSELENEESGTYYSYFSFIDGTSTIPFANNNGSDSPTGDKSAVENFIDDTLKDIKNWFKNNLNIDSLIKKIIQIILIFVLIVAVIKLLPLLFKSGKSIVDTLKSDNPNKKNRKK